MVVAVIEGSGHSATLSATMDGGTSGKPVRGRSTMDTLLLTVDELFAGDVFNVVQIVQYRAQFGVECRASYVKIFGRGIK